MKNLNMFKIGHNNIQQALPVTNYCANTHTRTHVSHCTTVKLLVLFPDIIQVDQTLNTIHALLLSIIFCPALTVLLHWTLTTSGTIAVPERDCDTV